MLIFILKQIGDFIIEVLGKGFSVMDLLYSLFNTVIGGDYSRFYVVEIIKVTFNLIIFSINNLLNYYVEIVKYFLINVLKITNSVSPGFEVFLKVILFFGIIVQINKERIEKILRKHGLHTRPPPIHTRRTKLYRRLVD